jgi:hypothetical protein
MPKSETMILILRVLIIFHLLVSHMCKSLQNLTISHMNKPFSNPYIIRWWWYLTTC